MAKEKFNLENSGLFAQVEEKKPQKLSEKTIRTNTAQEGLPANLTRATFIVDVEALEILKNYAYTERIPIKDVVNQALREYVSKIDKSRLLERPDKQR
jgi:hypothetical protein